MWFIALAVLLGVAAGKLRGGSSVRVADHEIRWATLLVAGLAARLLTSGLGLSGASLPLVASFLLLGAFAWGNLRLVGMPIFLLGLALNFAPVVVNGGMPVRGDAVVAAHVASAADLDAVDLGAGRHLEAADDSLTFLGDIVPIPFLREVVSFGDLILAAGLADVVANLMLPSRRRRRLPEHRDADFAPSVEGRPVVGDVLSVPPVDDITGEVPAVSEEPDALPVFDDLLPAHEQHHEPVITALRAQSAASPSGWSQVDGVGSEPAPVDHEVHEPEVTAQGDTDTGLDDLHDEPPVAPTPLRVFDIEAEEERVEQERARRLAEADPATEAAPPAAWDAPASEPRWADSDNELGRRRSARASVIDLVAAEAAEVVAAREARAAEHRARTAGPRAADSR